MQAGPRNAYFVDVGANIGAFTFLMAARGYDVYAFVPQQCIRTPHKMLARRQGVPPHGTACAVMTAALTVGLADALLACLFAIGCLFVCL